MSSQAPRQNFFASLLRLTRFGNLLIIALAQYFTAVCLIDPDTIYDFNLFLLVSSTVFIAAGGYIINDYYDVKIDFINKPHRVVVGRSITRRYAILFHSLFSFAGVLLGVYLSWWIGAVNFLSAFLLWWYSNSLKRLPFIGNFSIALLTGISIEIVDLLYASDHQLVTVYALFAFFMTLVREIIKDVEDWQGDETFGCRTLPIVIGIRKTKVVVYVILMVFALVFVIMNYLFVRIHMVYIVVLLITPLLILVVRLYYADTRKNFEWLSSFCKVIMLFGILSMAFIKDSVA